MLAWLAEKGQTPNAIERYWRQVLVSAINEELDRMAASHGLQVFWTGMLARSDSYEMGLAKVPLRDLYDDESLTKARDIRIHHRASVSTIERDSENGITALTAGDERMQFDYVVSCLPFERLQPLLPDLPIEWEFIFGLTAPLPIFRTRRCWIVRSSGCITRAAGATCNWWSVLRGCSLRCRARRLSILRCANCQNSFRL